MTSNAASGTETCSGCDAICARIAVAQAQTKADLAAFDRTTLIALREIESALTNYAYGLDRLKNLKNARDRAAKVAHDDHRGRFLAIGRGRMAKRTGRGGPEHRHATGGRSSSKRDRLICKLGLDRGIA